MGVRERSLGEGGEVESERGGRIQKEFLRQRRRPALARASHFPLARMALNQ